MGRLIDVDKLIKRFEVLRDEHETHSISYNALYEILVKEHTAFDTERVVEQLEEHTAFLKDCTKYGNKTTEQQSKSYDTMMMYEVKDLVDDLLDIVKAGGADAEH